MTLLLTKGADDGSLMTQIAIQSSFADSKIACDLVDAQFALVV